LLLCAGCGVEPVPFEPPPPPVFDPPARVVNVSKAGPLTEVTASVPITPPAPGNRLIALVVHESEDHVEIAGFPPVVSTGRANGCGRAGQVNMTNGLEAPASVDLEFRRPTTFSMTVLEVTPSFYYGLPPNSGSGTSGLATAPLGMYAGQLVVSFLVGCTPPALVSSDFTGTGVLLDSELAFSEVADDAVLGAAWETSGSWITMAFGMTPE
jgi:hypothetical protein